MSMTEHAQLGQPDPNRETQQASIHDVAQAVGVSVSTVSRSFTRPNLVSPRTREKVLRAAAELHFSISRSAMALKSGRSFRIALLLPSPITEWFNVNVYAGLNEVLQPAGYDISVFQISTNDARHRFFSEMPVRRNADAVVLCSFNTREDELSLLLGMGVPVVGINTSSLVGLDAGTSTDDVKSAEIATKHLISLGHRNIAYIYTSHDTPFTYSADDRHEGFQNAIRDSHADVSTVTISCPYDHNPVDACLTQLINLDPQPTALFFQTDDLAVPVMMRLGRYGKHVPRDYSIIGFDDIPSARDIGLTTMHQNPHYLGVSGAQKVLNLIESQNVDNAFENPTARLVLRQTTSPIDD